MSFSALVVVAVLMGLAIWAIPKEQARSVTEVPDHTSLPELENEFRKTLAQILGWIFLLLTVYTSAEELASAKRAVSAEIQREREALFTDRLAQAVGHLSAKRTATRLGGVYELERLSMDSPEDHVMIMNILTAFVREASGAAGGSERCPIEVEASVAVIGRRSAEGRQAELDQGIVLDLSGSCLREANLRGADLRNVWLRDCVLADAELHDANLRDVQLQGIEGPGVKLLGAECQGANFRGACMKGSILSGAVCTEALFEGADLSASRLLGTTLGGALFKDAWLSEASFSGAILSDETKFTGSDLSEADVSGALGLTEEHRRQSRTGPGASSAQSPCGR